MAQPVHGLCSLHSVLAIGYDENMETEKLVEKVIHDMNSIIGKKYNTPKKSKAQCARATQNIMERWSYKAEINVAWLYYQGDLNTYDIDFPGLCCDHFAVIVDSNIVIDYTLNQFFPQYPSPAVLDYEEWTGLFSDLWKTEPFFDMDECICHCGFGVSNGFDCEHEVEESEYAEENIHDSSPVFA